MRDLDSRDLIAGDFVFVFGDLVSNFAIEPALAKHRARREEDKNAILTMVLREVDNGHKLKSRGRQPTFVIDPDTDRCLQYEELGTGSADRHHINIDSEILTSHDTVEIRADLVDCNIDICAPDILGLWSDNFDYTTLRRSFLCGVLKDHELNGKTIHTHIVSDQYAARVRNLRMYDAVARDIIGRFTSPFCPDSNLLEGQSYQYTRGSVYKEDRVSLAKASKVGRKTVLGEGTKIGERSTIGDSTLGRGSSIGSDVEISGSYIWENVSMGNGSKVQQAIIAAEAVIRQDCVIEQGALIPFGARIADNTTVVPRHSRIGRKESGAQDRAPQTGSGSAGIGGGGMNYQPDSDDQSDTSSAFADHTSQAWLSESSISEFSETESEFMPSPARSRRESYRSDASEESAPNRDFVSEETASVLDGLQKGELPENIFLELNARRMGVNASQHEVRHVVVAAFLKRMSSLISEENEQQISARDAATEVCTRYQELVRRTIFDLGQEQKLDQVDFLLLVQKECIGRTQGDSLLLFIAKELYDLELIEEDGVLQWWEDHRSSREEMARVRNLTEKFVNWLRQAVEEGEESEASSEEDRKAVLDRKQQIPNDSIVPY